MLVGNYKSIDQQSILYSKYHEREIGLNSPVKKGKGCMCKKGCGKNCGCKNKCMKCHSGCFCNGTVVHDGRGSGGKNLIFSNGPNSTSECSKLLY